MADYFTSFSLILKLPGETAQKYALDLANQARAIMDLGDTPPADFPASLMEAVEDWQFETVAENSPEIRGIWLQSRNGGLDAVCAFIQHLLQHFSIKKKVAFEWSHDCSKPRIDAYGGGAAIITADKIKTMNTGQWLHQHAA